MRNIKEPVKILHGHSHWVWSVRYNRYHDQLLVSSSSDNLVKLWNVQSISSATKSNDDDAEGPPVVQKPHKSVFRFKVEVAETALIYIFR